MKEFEENASELSFFAGMESYEHGLLLDMAREVKKRKGNFLFKEGEAADTIWVIQKGRVKLSHLASEGNEQIIGIFSKDEAIWEGVFLRDSKYPYSAVCLTGVTAYSFDAGEFRRLLGKNVSLATGIITLLSRKLHDANSRNRILSTKNPSARIAGLLIYNSERAEQPYINLKLEDMAASINLRQETCSRKLREMEEAGLIKRLGKGKLQVEDYDAIRRIYEEE